MAHKLYYQLEKAKPGHRLYRIWNNARQRAKKSGIPFTITLDWFKRQLPACAVTGLAFCFAIGDGSGHGNPFCPSLDQKVPGVGYTPDNAQVVVWIYNCAKGAGKHEDVVKLAEALRS